MANLEKKVQAAACELVGGVRVMSDEDLTDLIVKYNGNLEDVLEVIEMVKSNYIGAISGNGKSLRNDYII